LFSGEGHLAVDVDVECAAAVGAWPAVALAGSYELLMVIIRGAQVSAGSDSATSVPWEDPLHEHTARVLAYELAAARVPSIRAIRAQLHVGQPRAQRIRTHLATLTSR
jgi:hypothetical protein